LSSEKTQVYLSLATGDSTDEDDPVLQRHRFEAGVDVWTTIQIEDDIESTTIPSRSYQIQ